MTSPRWSLSRATTRHSRSDGPGRHVGLHHLGNAGQVPVDARAPSLGDLQRDERGHRVADAAQVQLRAEAGDHPRFEQPIKTGLGGVPGHADLPGQLEHSGAGKSRQRFDQPLIDAVKRGMTA